MPEEDRPLQGHPERGSSYKEEQHNNNLVLKNRVYDTLSEKMSFEAGSAIAERIIATRETDGDSSLFDLIQSELKDLGRNPSTPNRDRITTALKLARAIITTEAAKRGVTAQLKKQIADAQHAYDWPTARRHIQNTDIDNIQINAQALQGWSEDFGGLLEEYRTTALMHMDAAYARVAGDDSPPARKREEELKYRSWGTTPADLESLAQRHLESQIRIEPEPAPPPATPDSSPGPAAFVEALREVFPPERITEKGFDGIERWSRETYQFSPQQPPLFYERKSAEEKHAFLARFYLHYAVHLKRFNDQVGNSVEGMIGNEYMYRLTNEDMAALWKIPGVKKAMSLYLKAIRGMDGAPRFMKDGVLMGYRDIKTINDADFYRDEMVQLLSRQVGGDPQTILNLRAITNQMREEYRGRGRTSAEVDNYVREFVKQWVTQKACVAEQVAFNLHYLANSTESGSYVWQYKNGKIQRGTQPVVLDRYLARATFIDELHPLDALIDAALKSPPGKAGPFSEWAAKQVRSLRNKLLARFDPGNKNKPIGRFEIIMNEDGSGSRKEMSQCWQVYKARDGVLVLNVPKCYPISTMGSFFEEIARNSSVNGSIIEAILNEQDINWSGNDFNWDKYKIHALKVKDLIDNLLNKKFDKITLEKALSKRGLSDDWPTIRWLIYGYMGIDVKSRLPRIQGGEEKRRLAKDLFGKTRSTKGLIPNNKMFFPWG